MAEGPITYMLGRKPRRGMVDDLDPMTIVERQDCGTTEKAVVVVGVPRGGTTLVATTLSALGVDMGGEGGNCERQAETAEGTRQGMSLVTFSEWEAEVGRVRAKVLRRGDCNWGFKQPYVWQWSALSVHEALANPHYILVTKDIVSIAQRMWRIGEARTPEKMMAELERQRDPNRRCLEWFFSLPPANKAVCSYQRILQMPGRFFTGLSGWLGLAPTESQLIDAGLRIDPAGSYFLEYVKAPGET